MKTITKKILFTSLIALTINSSIIPITAAQQNAESPTTEKPTETEKKKSPSMLEALLRLIKTPEKRLITRSSELCLISPGKIEEPGKMIEPEIYSEQPIFLWHGEVPESTIKLYSASVNYNYERDEQLIWSQSLPANTQHISYQGEPLQSGFVYDWELITADKTYRVPFSIMTENDRKAIAKDLARIKNRALVEGKEEEEIAISIADYFAQKKLWSDVLQQLYTLENPSASLVSETENLQQYFCD